MAAHQSPPSLVLQTRTLESVAISFSNAGKVKSESEVAQSCPTLSDPMDCSLPGSSVHGIFQARVLEWGAIAFSGKHCISWHYWLLTTSSYIKLSKQKKNNLWLISTVKVQQGSSLNSLSHISNLLSLPIKPISLNLFIAFFSFNLF